MDAQDRNQLFSAMHGGKPLKSYIKTILGKTFVQVWDSFIGQPSGLLLYGDPRKRDETSILDIWSEQEDVFFRRMNRVDLEKGILIEFKREENIEPENRLETSSDEELRTLINSKFFTIQHALNATDSIALLFRLKSLSEEMEKSDKIIRAIDARISEIQAKEFEPKEMPITEL